MFESYATVVIDQRVNKPLDYGIPNHLLNRVAVGSRVLVTLRSKEIEGTVLFIRKKTPLAQVAPILKLLIEERKLPKALFDLAEFMAKYYATPMRKVMNTIMPASVRRSSTSSKEQYFVKRAVSIPKLQKAHDQLAKDHPSQAAIIGQLLMHKDGILLSTLLKITKVSMSPIESLKKKQLIKVNKAICDRSLFEETEYFLSEDKTLNDEQQQALNSITSDLKKSIFASHLIFGVTGSGKTEVYLQAIRHCLAMNKSVIFIVPEIALTSQTIERLRTRFEERMVLLHHKLSDGERYDAWCAIRDGKAKLILGARSAVFSPAKDLGLIIVDEEQDSSLKQTDEMPCYHARDIAVMRSKIESAVTVLGSATPAIETFYNAKNGKYKLHTLHNRATNHSLAKVHIVDMQKEREKNPHLFSSLLIDKMKRCFLHGEQVLLFLNRRGTYGIVKCSACDEVVKCPHCDISMTLHKKASHLLCHLCGYTEQPPSTCPSCGSDSPMQYRAAGTEQVERQLYAIFPNISVLRMDADTTRQKGAHEKLFKQFRAGKADVLIGTQMVAKGLHFPNVSLVGVLQADNGLMIPDFRSEEFVFQLMTQVAGRAGRGHIAGEVIIQSLYHDHPVVTMASKQDYTAFYEEAIHARQKHNYPPYSKFIKIIASSEKQEIIYKALSDIKNALLPILPQSFLVTPITAPRLEKIKDIYRLQMLMQGPSIPVMSKAIQTVLEKTKISSKIKIHIDVDPVHTY